MHSTFDEQAIRTVRIGDVTFDPDTGDVTRITSSGEAQQTRLPPKPSLLLRMLIERDGGLVTIEEIRSELWPDVQVEFDQGMHHCMRQVRAAMGESASSPRYIETLPRRGYRLMVPVETMEDELPSAAQIDPKTSRMMAIVVVLILLLAMTGLAVIQYESPSSPTVAQPVRLAIMTFQPPDDSTWSAAPDIATLLTAWFGSSDALSVIGPSTTQQFRSSSTPLTDAATQLEVDYLINARFADRDGRQQMLIELVRAADGAHIWVHWFENPENPDAIARTIADGIEPMLDSVE